MPQVQVLSPRPYWNESIDTILSFLFFIQKGLGARLFRAFANEIRFIVSKLNIQKSKLSDSNLSVFASKQTTMTLTAKKSVIVIKISVIFIEKARVL